jgi:hypothetical protein
LGAGLADWLGGLRVLGPSDPQAYALHSIVDGLLGHAAVVIEKGTSLLVSDAGTRAALRREAVLGCGPLSLRRTCA